MTEAVFLQLGQRPDEAGPPISGPVAYPVDVLARLEADAGQIVARYPQGRSALLPLLHLVQSEDGYLTPAGLAFCAAQLGLTAAEVTAVATFYSMYRRTPTGDYLVGVSARTRCARSWAATSFSKRCRTISEFTPERPPTTAGSRWSTSSATPPATTPRW